MSVAVRPGAGHVVARVVTEVFAPAVLVAAGLVVVGWHAGSRWWGLAAAVFAAGIPLVYILRGVRRGRYADHHIPERESRRGPLLFGAASVVAGLVLLVVLGAPRDVTALLGAGCAGLVVAGAVNHWWKMSIHSAVAAGTVAVLVCVYGPWALTAAVMAAAVGWARLRLGVHTTAQVLVGAVVGALVAAVVFTLLR